MPHGEEVMVLMLGVKDGESWIPFLAHWVKGSGTAAAAAQVTAE